MILSAKYCPESITKLRSEIGLLKDAGSELVSVCPECIRYLPDTLLNYSTIKQAIILDPKLIGSVPENALTQELCFLALDQDPNIPEYDIPKQFYEAWLNDRKIKTHASNYAQTEYPEDSVSLINIERDHYLGISGTEMMPLEQEVIRYVSDLHLEEQLPLEGASWAEASLLIERKVAELVSSAPPPRGLLFVAGDVARNPNLEQLFYSHLQRAWAPGHVIAVLGNNELWNKGIFGKSTKKNIDEIIDEYKKKTSYRATLLENELLLLYKGFYPLKLNEEAILSCSGDDLSCLCRNSSLIVLGGIGFSGLNPKYNASYGLYRSMISTNEDKKRSERFSRIYKKVLECAAERRVFVLTHNPMPDWSHSKPNKNWIYLSGHTHINDFIKLDDKIIGFADNQIGKEPKKWRLKGFVSSRLSYDLFSEFCQTALPEWNSTARQKTWNSTGEGSILLEKA